MFWYVYMKYSYDDMKCKDIHEIWFIDRKTIQMYIVEFDVKCIIWSKILL